MDEKIIGFEKQIKTEYNNVTGVIVLKDGEMVYEGYFNGYTSQDTVHVMSVTKSIISALIGIAIDKGFINNVDQKVLEFFPEYTIKRGEKTIQEVTLRHMLTMTAPYKYRSEPYTRVYASDDWTKAALDLLGGRSGITGEFKYSTVGAQILSGILVRATGKSVLDFAAENLFAPLGIAVPQSKEVRDKEEHISFIKSKYSSGWIVDKTGVNTAGWGLCLTPRDMAKVGQLYLNGGIYHGRQILSSNWIEESTKEKSRWGELPYGYLWWIIPTKSGLCFAAIGDGGNMIFVHPNKKMVVALTALFTLKPNNKLELVTEHIIPMFE